MREADRVTREGPGATMPTASAPKNGAAKKKADKRPASDLFYLGEMLNRRYEETAHKLTPAGIQGLCNRYGQAEVASALRTLWGFPPDTEPPRSLYAYVEGMLRDERRR